MSTAATIPFAHADLPTGSTLHIAQTFAAAIHPWQYLEQHGASSPYQAYDWVVAMANTLETAATPLVLWMEDHEGQPLWLLPLGIHSRNGLRIARFYGGKHLNCGVPLLGPDDMPATADFWRAILRHAAGIAPFDILHLSLMPQDYGGRANPLLCLPHQRSPNRSFETELTMPGADILKERLSSSRLKGILKKQRRLGEHGTVRWREAATPEEAEVAYRAFLRHKHQRFKDMGVANIFEDAATQGFFMTLCRQAPHGLRQAGTLLTLGVDETIVALIGVTASQQQASCMIVSYDADDPWAACSPGQIAVLHFLEWAGDRGYRRLDLGVGEAEYKKVFCNRTVTLHEVVLPLTAKGHMAAPLLRGGICGRRAIKTSPRLWQMAQKWRQLTAKS